MEGKNVFTDPSNLLSDFCVVGTGNAKSKTEPLPLEACSSVGGMEVARAGSLWLSGAHCLPLPR